ncbi:TPA: hypothetical protein ACKQIG_004825 [Serratia marcescens]|nr:hypothetical protein SMKC069_48210 [Serratia marcescens]
MHKLLQQGVCIRRLWLLSRRMVWLGMVTVSMAIWGGVLGLIAWLEW